MTVSADARADAVKDGGFVHLHTHTEYSMLDGAAKLDDLFAEAQRLGMDSLAITDHGYLFGAYDFWSKAKAAGVKPIIGLEAYVAPRASAPHGQGEDPLGASPTSGGGTTCPAAVPTRT
ncbi:hypothetical protein GY12_26850 [Micrococcus luteus]|nr:hypothetical protein GY12_26850 [Micrococcus luteus]